MIRQTGNNNQKHPNANTFRGATLWNIPNEGHVKKAVPCLTILSV